ncbi:extracellular solute-binding protein [Arthrobacter sp. 24S4-2]|uniref:extracellular solute-binding protein n=1 Tax=Arthrobacter sp. 24S4-2 TaxID=2575374 RepID=UPI0010C7B35A|nr:extracellular solute-binding protein [Arthrobacter sp. 24S4-2]QCO96596.1 extracellular solute-binding protein [Arthrobacter sp. 24S4-2]
MKRRIVLLGALLSAGSLLTTACTPPGQASGSPNESLIIYSNSVSDGRGDWLKKEAAAAGFKLDFVDLGGGDVMNRLTAEKNNPVADVTFGLNNVYFEKLKAQNVLEPYSPAWAGEVDGSLGDQTGKQFWPIVSEPIMLVYNKAAYATPAAAPQDWTDLWTKDQFKGKYEVQTSLGGATTQMVLAGILGRYADPSGELGVSAEGWNQVKAYFANGNRAVKGEDLYSRMKKSQVDAGQMWLAGKASREKQYGIQTEAAKPSIGVPFAVQQVGLVKGTKKAETAKKFIDWFGSADVQAKWSKQFFTAPVNSKAAAAADAQAIEQTAEFKKQDIDWTLVGKNIDKWVEKIELEYLKG